MGKFQFESVFREQLWKPVCPLNGNDHVGPQVIGQSDRFDFLHPLQPVHVDMDDRKTPLVFVYDQERRARDGLSRHVEPGNDAADQYRLPDTQVTDQGEHLPPMKQPAYDESERFRFVGR